MAGELLDIAAPARRPGGEELAGGRRSTRPRSTTSAGATTGLWAELTDVEVFATDEQWRIDERVRRLNDLGFDVDELELVRSDDGSSSCACTTSVVEPGHHRRRLLSLHRPRRAGEPGPPPPQRHPRLPGVARTQRPACPWPRRSGPCGGWWRSSSRPSPPVPGSCGASSSPPELFHQLLEHRWFLSEQRRQEVDTDEAVADYVANVLPSLPDDRARAARPADPARPDHHGRVTRSPGLAVSPAGWFAVPPARRDVMNPSCDRLSRPKRAR